HREQFRGSTREQLAAWLRQILANYLAGKLRDVGKEQSLEAALEQSSSRLEKLLATGWPGSPGEKVGQERLEVLAQALAQLPDDQRTAVELQYLQDYSVEAIAQELGRTKVAVGGLLRRGMKKLRELLKDKR